MAHLQEAVPITHCYKTHFFETFLEGDLGYNFQEASRWSQRINQRQGGLFALNDLFVPINANKAD